MKIDNNYFMNNNIDINAFWKEKVESLEEGFNPKLFEVYPTDKNVSYSHKLSSSAEDFLLEKSKGNDLAILTLIVAGIRYCLELYSGQNNINFRTPYLLENALYRKKGTVPFIFFHKEDLTVKDYILDVQNVVGQSYTYQEQQFIELFLDSEDKVKLSSILVNYPALHSEIELDKNNFELYIEINRDEDGIILTIENHSYANREMIEQFVKHIDSSLVQFKVLERKIADVNVLTEQQTNRIKKFNGRHDFEFIENSVITLFEKQVNLFPDEVALIYSNKTLSYHELNVLSNQLARYLIEKKYCFKGDVIGVMMEKSDWSIIALLSILKTGAVYLPISTELPEDRIKEIVKDTNIKMILSSSKYNYTRDNIRFDIPVITIEDLDLLSFSKENINVIFEQSDLAYIIYTSGTTGKSKGVMIGHKGLANVVMDHVREFAIDKIDVCLQFFSSSFDGALLDIFMPLLAGGKLLLPSKNEIGNSSNLIALINLYKASIVSITPSYLHILDTDKLESVRVLVSAGEAAKANDLEYYAGFKAVYNGYGPSEASINTTLYRVKKGEIHSSRVPIGEPRANKNVYITDQNLNLVPEGVVGEICIASPGLALGYKNDIDLTNTKFLKNPFGEGKIYKTGDYGRWLTNGNIDFLGRKDEQIKFNGYRIDLTEIENVIKTNCRVKDIVVLLNVEANKKELVGFYISDNANIGSENLFLEEITSKAKEFLPNYMVPSRYISVDSIPTTLNGKVDKRKLLLMGKVNLFDKNIEKNVVLTVVEEQLKEIWAIVLGIPVLDVNENFFALGGHSLKVIQMLTKINEVVGVSLDIQVVFNYPTISQLALIIENSIIDEEKYNLIDEKDDFNKDNIFDF